MHEEHLGAVVGPAGTGSVGDNGEGGAGVKRARAFAGVGIRRHVPRRAYPSPQLPQKSVLSQKDIESVTMS